MTIYIVVPLVMIGLVVGLLYLGRWWERMNKDKMPPMDNNNNNKGKSTWPPELQARIDKTNKLGEELKEKCRALEKNKTREAVAAETLQLDKEYSETGKDNDLKELVRMMKEKLEMEEVEKRDAAFISQEKKRRKDMPGAGSIRQSGTNEDRKVNIKRSDIAVPFRISERDKQILEAFYGDGDLEK